MSFKIDSLKFKTSNAREIEHRRLLSNLKYKQLITGEQLQFVSSFLENKGYEPKEIVGLCERIRIYNNDLHKKYSNEFPKYAFLDLLRTNYEKFPILIPKNKISSNAKNMIDSIMISMPSYKTIPDKVVAQLPIYDDKIYEISEYKTIYYEVMRNIQEQIKSIVDMAGNPDFYFDQDLKKDVLTEYNEWIGLYIETRNFFDNQISNIKDPIEIDENTTEIKTKMYFAKTSNGSSFMERDLKSIPEESYETIMSLMKAKRYGVTTTLTDKQLLNSTTFKQTRELKNDQVRIIYKNLGNDSIVILGVGLKKDDNDLVLYRTLSSRNFDIDTTISEDDTYDRIIETCNENKRKGIR